MEKHFSPAFSTFVGKLHDAIDLKACLAPAGRYAYVVLRDFKDGHYNREDLKTFSFLENEFNKQNMDQMSVEEVSQIPIHFRFSTSSGWEVGDTYIRFSCVADERDPDIDCHEHRPFVLAGVNAISTDTVQWGDKKIRMETSPSVNQVTDMFAGEREALVKLNDEIIKKCGYSRSGKGEDDFGIRFFMREEGNEHTYLPPVVCRKVTRMQENYVILSGDPSLLGKSVTPVACLVDTDEMDESIPKKQQIECLENLLSMSILPDSLQAIDLPEKLKRDTLECHLVYEKTALKMAMA